MNKNSIIVGILALVLVACVAWVIGRRSVALSDVIETTGNSFNREDWDGETWIRIFGSWDFDSAAPIPVNDQINHVRIECGKLKMVCAETRVFVGRILKDEPYAFYDDTYQYDVVEWTDSKIRAVSSANAPEVDFVLDIDLIDESVLLTVRNYIWDGSTEQESVTEKTYTFK